ncbi:hypothetical protein AKJ37_03405 [candidate division MSBL1 archaeon SCGC-AAA259I09]|uniref:DNA primase DnaG n=1 Tax=candidate division MSBL1 archaeon SCGC-AAA259I09 TaxID=1698267 RepID=A0A133UST6_9EURY|nr:hypothetical protein AKJ37_03405 [candidate division MSBL1 archaeon SCGC-AAA259I09]
MGRKNRRTKYLIMASIRADGVVHEPDVVDALFNATGGILEDLDLRGLRRNGKIGRVEVDVRTGEGVSKGSISVPSRLGKERTAMIAAAMETVGQVGSCEAEVKVGRIQDAKEAKREFIRKRAGELVEEIEKKRETPSPGRTVTEGGLEKLGGVLAGPTASESDAVIIVQNRSEVINLLSHGIKNVMAIGGSEVPPTIPKICEGRTSTAFLDGDKGGDLVLKELFKVVDLDYVARAPEGEKVENLSEKEARKALKSKVSPYECSFSRDYELGKLAEIMGELRGSLKARILDRRLNKAKETLVRNLLRELSDSRGARAVAFDGIITQRLAELASEKGLKYLVGVRERLAREPEGIEILTKRNAEGRQVEAGD